MLLRSMRHFYDNVLMMMVINSSDNNDEKVSGDMIGEEGEDGLCIGKENCLKQLVRPI